MSVGDKKSVDGDQKVLTVSVAAYNVEDCIKRCLKSLVIDASHMKKLEVLVENDGSTDNTAEVAEEFVKKYPDTFKLINKENGGYGSTINNSIKLARGKYFKVLDGDDEFKTKNLPAFLDSLGKIDSDVVCSPCVRTFLFGDGKNIEENPLPSLKSGEKSLDILISRECKKGYFKMHTSAYRTEILKKGKIILPKHILYTDNIIAYVPLLYSKTVYFFDMPIYVYNIGREGQSVSIENRAVHSDDRVTVSEKVLEIGKSKSSPVFEAYAGIVCAGAIADHLLLCQISRKNRKRMMSFDEQVKNMNKEIWKNMEIYRTVRLLRMVRYSWIFYVLLHYKRIMKLRGVSG